MQLQLFLCIKKIILAKLSSAHAFNNVDDVNYVLKCFFEFMYCIAKYPIIKLLSSFNSNYYITESSPHKIFERLLSSMVYINVQPVQAMNDVPWHIKVTNLQPNQNYTLVSTCQPDMNAKYFMAYAHYFSDDNGEIDVDTMTSLSGTYTGIEPMGLMWSLTVEKEDQKIDIFSPRYNDRIFLKKNVLSPLELTIAVCNGHKKFEYQSDINVTNFLKQQTVKRHYMSPQCKRVPVREGRLRGSLFIPSGQGPFHAILDICGIGGGLQETRASLLASHHYVSFALAYYLFEDLPSILEIEIEYFLEAIDFVMSLPMVKTTGIGILSSSFGASLAMHIATICPKVRALVSINGASYMPGGKITFKNKTLFSAANWEEAKFTDRGISIGNIYPLIDERCIPIERAINCKFLIINGVDDRVIPYAHGEVLNSRTINSSQLQLYQEAGHIIEPPFNPPQRDAWLKVFQTVLIYGGSIRGHAHAQEAAWKEVLSFFLKHLYIESML